MSIQQPPPNQTPEFRLQFIFDKGQIDRAKLESDVRSLIRTISMDVKVNVGLTPRGHPLLTLAGNSIEILNECHQELLRQIVNRRNLHVFRLVDDPGDEYRSQAYNVLAEIEQLLRAFINQSIVDTEILGFEWWSAFGDTSFPELDEALKKRLQFSENIHLHPLELTTFDELINIVTRTLGQWDEQHAITPSDLSALLEDTPDINALKDKLDQKLRKFSFWDNVFAPYFAGSEREWQTLKSDLGFVVTLRNKVMHHRAFFAGELQALRSKGEGLKALLASARQDLSVQEREEIKKRVDLSQLRSTYGSMLLEAAGGQLFHQIYSELYNVSTVEEVTNSLQNVEDLGSAGNLNERQMYDLKVVAFRSLRNLTIADPSLGRELMLGQLLPLCLEVNDRALIAIGQLRECLAEWLSQYPEIQPVRDEMLDKLAISLDVNEPNVRAVCWTIARVGYRRSDIVEALWKIVEMDSDQVGDTALSTISELGVPIQDRERLLETLHKRAAERFSNTLAFTLGRLRDPSSIEIMFRYWLNNDMESKLLDMYVVFAAIRDILGTNLQNNTVHDSVIDLMSEFRSRQSRATAGGMNYSQLFHKCNSNQVVHTLFDWLAENLTGPWGRQQIQSLLSECVIPNQVEGWAASLNNQTLELLKQDACQNTKNDFFAMTEEVRVKDAAWETLLCARQSEALTWFDDAVSLEEGRFVQQRVMELLACFQLKTIPPQVTTWVQNRVDLPGEAKQDGREYGRVIGATEFLQSCASEQAFEILLRQGFTVDGNALRSTSDALAQVAEHLIRQGNETILPKLVETVVTSGEPHHRAVATGALALVANLATAQLSGLWERLAPLLFDQSRSPYEIGLIVSMIDKLEGITLSTEILSNLKAWATTADRWEGGNSLNVLASLDILQDESTLLTNVLGLQESDGHWDWTEGAQPFEWTSYTLGILYHRHPQKFVVAVANLLKSAEWQLVYKVLGWIYRKHRDASEGALPQELTDAIVERTLRFQTSTYGETQIFSVMSDLAPEKFTHEPWQQYWETWLPDSREAMASALGKVNVSDSATLNAVIQKLEVLAGDAQYQVRRESFRGIARQSMDELYRLCVAWSELNNNPSFRARAAEAVGWLEMIVEGKDLFEELYAVLSTDPEKRVRDTVKRSNDERNNRIWSKNYLSKVEQAMGGETDVILQAWAYGQALTKVGDDEAILKLDGYRQRSTLSPHVRQWLNRLHSQLTKNWGETVRKWPEPWFSLQGMIEKGRGKAHFDDSSAEVTYSIWRNVAGDPSETSSWGGVYWPFSAMAGDILELQLEGNRRGKIHVTHSKQGSNESFAVFIGSGPYPADT